MGFIKTPNLPENKVTHIIAGSLAKPYEKELERLKIKLIYSEDNPQFSTSLKAHADLFVNYLGNSISVLDGGQIKLKNELESLGMTVITAEKRAGEAYPADCLLNCVLTDDIIICNRTITDRKILDFAEQNRLKILEVKQGYCKCSVLTVEKNAFITDDAGIYKALKAERFDCLLVEKGSVALEGFNYGFIGGCCGKISKNVIAFCGDIKKHKNYNDIKSFLSNYGIEALSLSNGALTDAGSLIPIIEK